MTVAASVQFTQGATVGGAGFALVGVTGTSVTVANGNNTNVVRWVFTLLDVPPGSAIIPGLISDGPSSTASFLPDVAGCYRMQVDVYGILNLTHSVDVRAFIVRSTRGWIYPAFRDIASELNFVDSSHPSGNARGWTTALEQILKDLENVATTVVPAGGPFLSNQVGTATTATPSLGYTPNAISGLPELVITSAGTGIFNYWSANPNLQHDDQLQFINRPVTGDFEIACRISAAGLPALSEVGISLRESMAPNARAVTVFFSPLSATDTPNDSQARDSVQTRGILIPGIANGSPTSPTFASTTPNPPVGAYVWLKLTRVGQDVGAYWSRDGIIWIPNAINGKVGFGGSAPVFLGDPTAINYAGFFVTSNSQSVTVTATLDNIYMGTIRSQYLTSWIGNTFSQRSKGNKNIGTGKYQGNDGCVNLYAEAMYLDPITGFVYTNSHYGEDQVTYKIYANGAIVTGGDNGHFGQGGSVEGSITGDGTNVYLYAQNAVGTSHGTSGVFAVDKTTGLYISQVNFGSYTIGAGGITGMACNPSLNELYLSDYSNNKVIVVNTSTMAYITGRDITFTQNNPGPIAVDTRGNLWILSLPAASPLLHKYTATQASGVYNYSAAGSYLSKSITTGLSADASGSFTFPTNVSINPNADEIWVCDNGVDQNIKIFNNLTTTPTLNRHFGVTGGIYSGATPGLLNDPAAGGWNRLYSLTAARVDNAGNVYVTLDGTGSDIRKFDALGNLIWRLVSDGDECFGCPDFDQSTNAADAYSRYKHYKLNLSSTVPGGEWSDYAFTYNPFAAYASNDFRPGVQYTTPLVRNLGGTTCLFWALDANAPIHIHRKVGEIFVPCGRFTSIGSGVLGSTQLWIDANGNGLIDSGETTTVGYTNGALGVNTGNTHYSVDTGGDLWWAISNSNGLTPTGQIIHFVYTGVNGSGVPVYSVSGGNYENLPYPAPFIPSFMGTATVKGIFYDKPNDAMYITGDTDTLASNTHPSQVGGPGSTIARYDSWSTIKNTLNPEPRYLAALPRTEDGDGNWFAQLPYYDPALNGQLWPFFKGLSQANRYVFVAEEFGHIRIWDALIGNWCYSLSPGAAINSEIGFTDVFTFRSFMTSNGQYQIFMEDSALRGSETFYRWTPNRTPTAPPLAVTNVVAAGDNFKIRVSWNDWGRSFIDSYNVYRTIGTGAEVKIATGIQAVKYIDTTAPTGSPISYRITAVNAAGESPFSASATGYRLTPPAPFTPTFDTTTKGSWKGVYGFLGSWVFNATLNQDFLPPAVKVTLGQGFFQQVLAVGSNPAVALQSPGVGATTNELARTTATTGANAYGPAPFDVDIVITDGSTRQIALYFAARFGSGENLGVTIKDPVTPTTLYTTTLTAFDNGTWVVFNASGHITVHVDPTVSGGIISELMGIFVS